MEVFQEEVAFKERVYLVQVKWTPGDSSKLGHELNDLSVANQESFYRHSLD